MGFFSKDNLDYSESGNWNSAKEYSERKILKYSLLADDYEVLAYLGSLDIVDELINMGNTDEIKIRGFRRLLNVLGILCSNSYFAMEKTKTAQGIVEGFRKEIKDIEKEIPNLFMVVSDQINKIKRIKLLDGYEAKLERVSEIKKLINVSLNEADLIFIHKETFDPKDYKKKIFDQATTQG